VTLSAPRKVPTPWPQRLADFRRGPLVFAVWLAAAVASGLLLARRASTHDLVGLVEAARFEVGAQVVGRVERVQVELLQEVSAGDPIAVLVGDELDARLATAAAAIEQLAAALGAERVALEIELATAGADELAELRRFRNDEQGLRIEVLALATQIETDRVERERLELLASYAERLAASAIGPESEREDLRLQGARVSARIAGDEQRLGALEAEVGAARERLRAFEEREPLLASTEARLRPTERAIDVASLELEELRVLRESLVVRAPVTGQVTSLAARAGATALPGEALAAITSHTAGDIVAWLPEATAHEVRLGTPVRLHRVADPTVSAESRVTRVAAAIEELPLRLWRDPAFPEYGRAILVARVSRPELLPGEAVRVLLAP
jgi:multidrug resistance efflux pump